MSTRRLAARATQPASRGALVIILLTVTLAAPLAAAHAAKARPGKNTHRQNHNQKAQKHAKAKRSHTQRVAKVHRNPAKLVMPPAEASPVLDVAQQFLGQPYRFGSSGGAYDCSGFVRRVFGELGVELPHSAQAQFDLGDMVSRDDLLPGDLVFFRTYKRGPSHVGIYIADDKFIHAATRGGQVQVDSLEEAYYANRYLGARRVEPQS